MPNLAVDAADASDPGAGEHAAQRTAMRQARQAGSGQQPGAQRPHQPRPGGPKPEAQKQKKPDQSAGPPQAQDQQQEQVKPQGNPIFDALGLPLFGLSPELQYEVSRSAASTWSHLINPQQRESFLATASTDRMHSRLMSKITDTLSNAQPTPQPGPSPTPQPGPGANQAPNGNQMVPKPQAGPAPVAPSPMSPHQQRDAAMHSGLNDFFQAALAAPGEGLSWFFHHADPFYDPKKDPFIKAGVQPSDPHYLSAGYYTQAKPKGFPDWQQLTDDQKKQVDKIYQEVAMSAAKGPDPSLNDVFSLGEGMGLAPPQQLAQQGISAAIGTPDPIAKAIWNATKPEGDPEWDKASDADKQQFMAVLSLAGLKIAEGSGGAKLALQQTKMGNAVSNVAWAHLASTVAAGRKLPGVDRVVNRILPGADAVDRHMANELNVVSGSRRERSPQMSIDPKKGPIEAALDIPPAENISTRARGGKEEVTFQGPQAIGNGELIDRVSNMPEANRKAFFKKMDVADLEQFKRLVEGKRMSAKQVAWLAKSWKNYFPYDLRRVDAAEHDLVDPRQHLDSLEGEHQVNGQEFLASTHGMLGEAMTGPFGSDKSLAGSMTRSLLGLQRGTSATFQRWQDSMVQLMKGQENMGELEFKALEGDKAAYDQLTPQQKLVMDSHRMLEASLRKMERQWGVRTDHVPYFAPRRFVRPPTVRKSSTAGARPGAQPLTGAVRAHREEVFQVETPEQAQERIGKLQEEQGALQEELASNLDLLSEYDAQEQRKGGPGYALAKTVRNLKRDINRIDKQLKYTDPQYILQQRFKTVQEANAAILKEREAMVNRLTADPEEGGQAMEPEKAQARAEESFPLLETNYYKVAPQDLARRIHALHAHQAVNQLVNTVIEDKGEQLQAAYRGVQDRGMTEILANRGYRSLNWGSMRDVLWHPHMADILDRAHALESMPKGKAQKAMRALERQMIGKIMYSPMLHGMNVAGRVGWYMVSHPLAFTEELLKTIGANKKPIFDRETWNGDRRRDAYNAGLLPHSPSGKYGSEFYDGMALATSDTEVANSPGYSDMTDAPARVQNSPLAGAIGLGKAVGKGYEGLNNMFWSRVNDFGVLAYQVEKHAATKAGLDESTARLYAADRANAWVGQVRPERWMPFMHEASRLVFFAPNWWRTFGELTLPMYDKTGLVKNAALRQHVVKNEMRTLMAMWLWQHISGNALNMMLSGHPQWENQPGNQDRLELDNFFPIDPQTGAHMTLEPFLTRQTYAAEKSVGLESGHPGWNVEDVPGGMAAEIGGRLSPLASAIGDVGNIDLYQSFSKGQLYRIDPKTGAFHPGAAGMLSALSSLVPFAPGFDVTRGLETIATKGGGPDEALGIPGTGNTTIPKNIKDLLGKGAERFLMGLIGINPPYPYAERSRGQNLSQDELIKVKQQGDQYYSRLQELGKEMFSGQTAPQDAIKQYHDLTTAYQGFLSAEFQNAPYYTHGSLGLYHAWEDTYKQATGPDGQIDWAKLDDLQAKFEHDHTSAEMSAIHSFSTKSEVKAPFLRIYHETIQAYRDFQQQQAGQLGISVTDLRRATSQYGALYNDRLASAQFIRDHPEIREYEQNKRNWEETTNAGLMYGLFYNTGTVVRWLRRHGMDAQQLMTQLAGQGQLAQGDTVASSG